MFKKALAKKALATKALAAVAALCLTGAALVGVASPALADDETPSTETTSVMEETTTEVVEAEAPVPDAGITEPAAEPEAPEPPATEPDPNGPAVAEPATEATKTTEAETTESSDPESGGDESATAASELTELGDTADDNPSAMRTADVGLFALLAAPVKKVQFCHATSSGSNVYNFLDTSVNAFFNSGHNTHQNGSDIVPPFSYEKQGEIIDFPGMNWDAAGQAIFFNGCEQVIVVPGIATASVFFTAASCTLEEQLVLGTVTNATWGPITDPAGTDDYSVTAFANPGSEFAGGLTSLTFQGELDPIDMSEECDNTLVKKVEFCHATGNDAFQKIETSVNAFFNSGHDTHQNGDDVVPPFSYIKQGEVIDFPGQHWDAAGQAFFLAGCQDEIIVIPDVATASVSFTPATCTTPELLVLGAATNATWGPVTDPLGDEDYFVTATADDDALFAGGLTEVTFHGELDPIDTTEECDDTLVKKVEFCHATGSENMPFVKIETSVNAFFNAGHDTHQNFEDVVPPFSYLKQGEVINFAGLNWDAEGEAFLKNGCKPAIEPMVTFTQFTCTAAASYTLGVAEGFDPATVTFTVNGTVGVLSGTYPATVGETTVTVQPVVAGTLSPGWVNPPAFEFVKPAAASCPSVLALTGAGLPMGPLSVGGGLLFVGLAALWMRRRQTTIG